MSETDKYTELLTSLLSIPAFSKEENIRADFLEVWLKKEGLCVIREKNNIIVTASPGAHDEAEILLNSHIDTVIPADNWESDPFAPVSENGRITALGSNDAGASVVALIFTYIQLSRMKIADKFVLVLSAEEEISGKNGLQSVLPILPNVRFGIVGEPTGMQPAVAERGLMVVDGISTGKSGHAARNEGINAIYKAIRDIDSIRNMQFNVKSDWLDDPSAQVTMINAGTGHNTVPGKCTFVIDVRSNDKYSNNDLLKLLQEQCDSELIPRSLRLNSSFLSENHSVFNVFEKLKMKPFGSPTLSDMALLDFPAIKIGPGDSSRSHTANEYIFTSEINEGVNGYLNLTKELNALSL